MLLHLVAACGMSGSNAVTVGASDPVWDPLAIPILRITFETDDWASELAEEVPTDPCADRTYVQADLEYENPQTGETERYTDVGVRYRGHSALFVENESSDNRWGYKISFDEYVEDRTFHGLKKLVLLGTEGDYSLLRERLALQLMREAGVPASRANHARVYVNGEYQGLFPNVEEADDGPFLEARFGDKEGSLYKAAGYCLSTNMDYEGEDILSYDTWESKTGTDDEDKVDDLIPMFRCLAPGEDDFEACIQDWVDVDEWFTEMAVDVLLPNIDGMQSTGQNILLFRPESTGEFVVYPYDMDLAFYGTPTDFASTGIFDMRPNWEATPPVLPRALREAWPDEYCEKVLEVSALFEPDRLEARIQELAAFLEPDIYPDPLLGHERWSWAVDDVLEVATTWSAEVIEDAERCDPP